MEAGNVNEFIDNLSFQDEMIRYKGKLYYFYGVRFDKVRNIYYTSIDEFNDDINHFSRELFYFESSSSKECFEHLTEDKYWNGKSFWDVESEFTWVDE